MSPNPNPSPEHARAPRESGLARHREPDREAFPFPAFTPSRWAPGPHLQTLLARVLLSGQLPYRRERLETPDGDFLDLDWGPEPGADAPIVLVMHGLEGCSERGYVRSVCSGLTARGMWAAALNFRGCSGQPNRAERFYHSGATDDPLWVLETLRARHPQRSMAAVGFSLGGNILLKLMGERPDGGRALLDAAVAMSVPYDLSAGCSLLEQSSMGRMYATYFLRSLKRKVRAKHRRLADRLDLDTAYRVDTLRGFDDLVTAPLHGFRSAEDYYGQCSSNRYLSEVRVPTLLLHAADDPFLPEGRIPRGEAADNRFLRLLLHREGGHVGFLEGTPWNPRFWGDERTVDFLAHRLL